MRVSWNVLNEYLDLKSWGQPSDLIPLLASRGLEVQEIEILGRGLEKVVTARIVEMKPHPQADRLRLCSVQVGDTSLEIVCGAQNMKQGDCVALAQVGACLPQGQRIAASTVRGVVSHGMLCSEQELGLKAESEGIFILPSETPMGLPLADFLALDDQILVLKLTPNRSDCLSHWGLAREIASALGKKLSPLQKVSWVAGPACPIDASVGLSRFCGVYLKGVKVGPSPDWLVSRLKHLGVRSVNNVVDATQWLMLEVGHPVHAYDAQKIVGKLQFRLAKQGESLVLLNGQKLSFHGTQWVVSDSEKLLGLPGVMGGVEAAVEESTEVLFLECAEFDPVFVRRTAKLHGLSTESSYRFERGVDPGGLESAMGRLLFHVLALAGGEVVSGCKQGEVFESQPVVWKEDALHDLLGLSQEHLSFEKTEQILESLDCQVKKESGVWSVVAPSYRLDLNHWQDFAEEVGRCLGYDAIPATLPGLRGDWVFARSDAKRWEQMQRAKQSCVRSGLQEVLNFGFCSQHWLADLGIQPQVLVSNPLSEEYSAMVPSLFPGLLKNALYQQDRHFGADPFGIRLFEFRPVFLREDQVLERWKLAFLLAGPRYFQALKKDQIEVDFFDLKAVVDGLAKDLGMRSLRYQPFDSKSRFEGSSCFHPGQSAELWVGQQRVGFLGRLHPQKADFLKTRTVFWMGEMDWELWMKFSRSVDAVSKFRPWSSFPPMERDFSLMVPQDLAASSLCQLALKAGKPLVEEVKIFDVYTGSQVGEGMTSVSVRVIFQAQGCSLREAEVETLSSMILDRWQRDLGVVLRK